MSDKEIKPYNFKTNNKKNLFNKDYINSISNNSKKFFSSFNNISNKSTNIPNLKLSTETSFKRKSMNTASNIINIVNNLPKAKGKVKVKMNINKYNIKYYVTNENFEKIIENINLNKTEGNKIRLRLEKTKHKKPFSADYKNMNIDNNNDNFNDINKKKFYKLKKFIKSNNNIINKNNIKDEKIFINRENTLNNSNLNKDIKTLNLQFNNIDIIGDLDSETEKTSSSNSSNNSNVLKLNEYRKFTKNFLNDNKINLKKKFNNQNQKKNYFRTNFNDYNNIIPINNGSLEFKPIYQTSDNLININKNSKFKKDNSLNTFNKNENSIDFDNNNINIYNEIKNINNNINNEESESNQSNEKVIVKILESFKDKKKIKSNKNNNKNLFDINHSFEKKCNNSFKNNINENIKNNYLESNISINNKNKNLNDNNNDNKPNDNDGLNDIKNKKRNIPKRRSSMIDINKLNLINLEKKSISFRRKREINQLNVLNNNSNCLDSNNNQNNNPTSKFLFKLFINKNTNNNNSINNKFDLDISEKSESKSFLTSISDNFLNKIDKDIFYKKFEENIQIKLIEIENRKNKINNKIINNFIDKNFDELDKKIKIKEKEYLIKEGIELDCKLDINFLINKIKKFKLYKKEKKYQNFFYYHIFKKNKKIFYEKINKIKICTSLKYHILDKHFDINEEIYYFCFNIKNRLSTDSMKKSERRKTRYSVKKQTKILNTYSLKNVQKFIMNKNIHNYKIKRLLIESLKHRNNQEYISDFIMKESYKNNLDLKPDNIFINNIQKNENNDFFINNFFKIFNKSSSIKVKSLSNNYVNNSKINLKKAAIEGIKFNNINMKNVQKKQSIKNAQTFFKKTIKRYIEKEKKKKKKLSIISHISLNNINKIDTQEILKDNIINKISNSPKKRLLITEQNNINVIKNPPKKSLKSIDLFSASNKYVTQIQTDKIKNDMLESLGDNLYKVIFFYIKENNYNKVNYLIKQNSEFINMNYRDNEGYTFLNTSLRYNCKKEIIEFLIKCGSNPNISDNRGNTPLHYALSHKNFQVVNLLIKFGADENIENCFGLCPWQCVGINLETFKKK